MRHELTSIDAYRLAIDAAQSIKELEDIAEDMIGHSEHGCQTIDELRVYLTGYCDEWQSGYFINDLG